MDAEGACSGRSAGCSKDALLASVAWSVCENASLVSEAGGADVVAASDVSGLC